ncbi:hypothetical protein [Microcoleus sp. bin38.metabat.b11b12b14.051]|uniref:hypothetical protein n=1 Tax=Microcoleus sp. bin38.metabat.b11b12b14.051 TaxID=2742709 RepID=UPI0025E3D2BA|nr:hypothetical protein [Microcoleus sp. bin38.metabat.b11b12b14.051]
MAIILNLADRPCDTNRSHNSYPLTVAQSLQSAIAITTEQQNNSSPNIEPLFPSKIP